jgi:ankyrin repeat protein
MSSKLELAVLHQDYDQCLILLNTGEEVKRSETTDMNEIHTAIKTGNLKIVELLFDKSPGVRDYLDVLKCSYLHYAASTSTPEICEFFVKRGFLLNDKDFYGNTALDHAVDAKKFLNVVKLIELGARINNRNRAGSCTLHRAVFSGDYHICEEILKKSDDFNITDFKNNTALHYLAESIHKSLKIYLLLARYGVDPKIVNDEGKTFDQLM